MTVIEGADPYPIAHKWTRTVPGFPANRDETVVIPEQDERGVHKITGQALEMLLRSAGFKPAED